MDYMKLVNEAKVLEWRRHMHRYPELSFQEENTSSYIAEQLAEYPGVKIICRIKTGIVAVLDSNKPGKTVALRADFDALPIQEEADVECKSQNDGVFHACGHDCHAAILLGAVDALYKINNEGKLNGKVVFIFQHAEELLPGGAKDIIDDGVLHGLGIDAFYAMHVFPNDPVGTVKCAPGIMSANTDIFRIDIQGKGSHGAKPEAGIDSLLVGTEVVQALNFIVSRNVAASNRAVLSVCKFHAGTAPNIIPDTASIEGTVRTMKPTVRDMIERKINEISQHICAAYGATCEVAYTRGYTAIENDEGLNEAFGKIATKAVPGIVLGGMEAMMGGEDFSAYQAIAPTLFVRLGVMPDSGEFFVNHHPKFVANEKALPIGTALYTAFAAEMCGINH
ncbi:MAG: amidohydrolase [Defluviitaleaceae bacterium]|nr:amidohydrolase [Defluviitaleaceae bacterium]